MRKKAVKGDCIGSGHFGTVSKDFESLFYLKKKQETMQIFQGHEPNNQVQSISGFKM